MIIKNAKSTLEIEHRGFVFFETSQGKESLYMDWNELTLQEEQEILNIRGEIKRLLKRGMNLYEKVQDRCKDLAA